MLGKHSAEQLKIKELEETIKLKDKEITDIKHSLADVLLQIRPLNEANEYGDPSQRKRKISELCTQTRYELYIDEIKDDYPKEEKAKIIELPTTHKSNK